MGWGLYGLGAIWAGGYMGWARDYGQTTEYDTVTAQHYLPVWGSLSYPTYMGKDTVVIRSLVPSTNKLPFLSMPDKVK